MAQRTKTVRGEELRSLIRKRNRVVGDLGLRRDFAGGSLRGAGPDTAAVVTSSSNLGTPSRPQKRFVINTPTVDRYGDVIEPAGVVKHLAEYARNPVVYLNHNSVAGLPIGRTAAKPDGSLDLEIVPGRHIVATGEFNVETRTGADVWALIQAGDLRAASIGFLPFEGEARWDDEAGIDFETLFKEGKARSVFASPITFRFTEWSLLEWSVVGTPANPDCMAKSLAVPGGVRSLSRAVRRALAGRRAFASESECDRLAAAIARAVAEAVRDAVASSPEAKPETKPEAKPETKPEAKLEEKPEEKPEEKKPEEKTPEVAGVAVSADAEAKFVLAIERLAESSRSVHAALKRVTGILD